jgi:zinc/manganese transport system permease protein
VQLFAGSAALGGALLLSFTDKKLGALQEPLIGVLFVLAATGGLLLLAQNPHGGDALKDLLAGQILWVSYSQLGWSAAVMIPCTLAWLTLRQRLGNLGFYILFALVITTSVQLAGVYLVFASLVIPALGVRHWDEKSGLVWGWVLGMCGYLAGLYCSLHLDLPAAPLIVWCLALLALVFGQGIWRRNGD